MKNDQARDQNEFSTPIAATQPYPRAAVARDNPSRIRSCTGFPITV